MPAMRSRSVTAAALLLFVACDSQPREPAVPMHDHTPHHGGVVSMVGMLHLEVTAAPDGRVRVYLTDRWRKPLPVDGVSGTVVLHLPDGRKTLALTAGTEVLEASGPPLDRDVVAAVTLQRDGEPIEANFSLPISGSTGAAGIPTDGCLPPDVGRGEREGPRCTLRFAKPVPALAAAPNGGILLVAVVDNGLSAWRLPAGVFMFGFAAAPAVPMPVPEPPHPEAPNAVAVRPDGKAAAVALENRIIIYALDSGQILHSFNGPGGIVRAVAWSPDGVALLVTAFYQAAASVLDASDGRVQRAYTVEREGAAVDYSADGSRIAVGSETGAVVIFDAASGAALRTVRIGRGPVRVLAFAGDLLLAGGDDGALYAWDASSGSARFQRPVGGPIHRLALSPQEHRVAVATGKHVSVIDLSNGALIQALDWHDAQILGLAWGGSTLVTGDVAGRVALWDETT